MPEQKFDAIVVGAGPAGSACGYTLAKAGLDILVVERGKFPGAKNMWGGAYYGPLIHELFPQYWEEAPVERFIKRRKFSFLTNDSALSVEFTTKRFAEPPYNGFSVLRAKFDRWLAAKAEQAGAIVASGLQADDLLWEGGKVSGIKAGGDDIPAAVVVACDGANSILAEKAGLRSALSPKDMKQGIKEVIQLSKELIDRRFNLTGKEGLSWEFLGTFTQGIPGGGFLYTNEDSLSIGVVVQLSGLTEKNVRADDLLEEFKLHPEVACLLKEGNMVEYSAHLIPVSGMSMIPELYGDGILVAGDAAALILATGLALEGANFAIASGAAAAETVIAAKKTGDFSKNSLAGYRSRLEQSFVLKDLKTFKKAPRFLENPRLYRQYPELLCKAAENIFTNDGLPREKTLKLLKDAMAGRISFLQISKDLWQIKGSL
ncbi:MAG: FAD-binding protein [Candidatus Aminicenantes bacterium]|nr:FAD-binding protein [Candidatus Aminicenantes bacterium]